MRKQKKVALLADSSTYTQMLDHFQRLVKHKKMQIFIFVLESIRALRIRNSLL